jgi:hypothetical protein
VAAILAKELGRDEKWEADQIKKFGQVAAGYVVKR